ncbi:hypothetical protein BGZ98_009008 [Dissophora globulifera]|nr:hypothetical protein BGZ98_009008 [Dissophora globulifera]
MTVPETTNTSPVSIPVHIPTLPPIRSTTSSRSTSSTSTTLSTVSHLSDRPIAEVTFRHGRVEDAPYLTDLQFSNYRYHYKALMGDSFLDRLVPEDMTKFHASRLTPPVDQREMGYVVAEQKDPKTGELGVIGMSQVIVPYWDRAHSHRFYEGWSQEDFDCEIDTLYVKLGVQGGGLGRKLVFGAMQEGYDRLNMRGAVIIWTMIGNTQGREFYKRIGCEEVGERILEVNGVELECVAYGFRDIGRELGLESK